jgi:hypothetical protein
MANKGFGGTGQGAWSEGVFYKDRGAPPATFGGFGWLHITESEIQMTAHGPNGQYRLGYTLPAE